MYCLDSCFLFKNTVKISFFPASVFLEFRPGEPWKGYPNIDPETDPYVTPGSVINNLSINTVREVDHLRDRNSGMLSLTGELCVTFPQPHRHRCRGDVYCLLPSWFIPCLLLAPLLVIPLCLLLAVLVVVPSVVDLECVCCLLLSWFIPRVVPVTAAKLIFGSALLLMQCRSCPRNVGCALHPDVSCAHPGVWEHQNLGSPAMQECWACALRVLLLPPCARGLRMGTEGCMSLP